MIPQDRVKERITKAFITDQRQRSAAVPLAQALSNGRHPVDLDLALAGITLSVRLLAYSLYEIGNRDGDVLHQKML